MEIMTIMLAIMTTMTKLFINNDRQQPYNDRPLATQTNNNNK